MDDPKTAKEPLTLNGLLSQLKAKGLVPVRVVDGFSFARNELRFPILAFDGALSDFIDTAAALSVNAIFVSASEFVEYHFIYKMDPPPKENLPPLASSEERTPTRYRMVQWGLTPDGQPLYRREPIPPNRPHSNSLGGSKAPEEETLPERIDLAEREPRLKPFRKRIGQPFKYVVSFSCSETVIRLCVQEAWYAEFEALREEVIDAIDAESYAAIVQQKEERVALIASLKPTLLNDAELMSTPDHYSVETYLGDDDTESHRFRRDPEKHLRDHMEKHLREKYPDVVEKLGLHLGELLRELLEESAKKRNEESVRRAAERRQQHEEWRAAERRQQHEEAKANEDRKKKLAALRQSLPEDQALMALPSMAAMRTYLLDKHPELLGTLVTSKQDKEDFLRWLFSQKKKS